MNDLQKAACVRRQQEAQANQRLLVDSLVRQALDAVHRAGVVSKTRVDDACDLRYQEKQIGIALQKLGAAKLNLREILMEVEKQCGN